MLKRWEEEASFQVVEKQLGPEWSLEGAGSSVREAGLWGPRCPSFMALSTSMALPEASTVGPGLAL